MKRKKVRWYEFSPKRVTSLLFKVLGTYLAISLLYAIFIGFIKPELSSFTNSSKKTNTYQNKTQQAKQNQKVEWEERREEYSEQKLLTEVKVKNYLKLDCTNMKTFYDKDWGITFRYSNRFRVGYGDSSSPTTLFDGKDQINIGHPSAENKNSNPEHYYFDSIESSIKEINTGEQLYLSYYDQLTKLVLPHKNIYGLKQQQFVFINLSDPIDEQDPYALQQSKTFYQEFNNNNCQAGVTYSRLGEVSDEEFLCTVDSTKLLCD